MSFELVNVGSGRLATDGECIRDAFVKINSNFTNVFTLIGVVQNIITVDISNNITTTTVLQLQNTNNLTVFTLNIDASSNTVMQIDNSLLLNIANSLIVTVEDVDITVNNNTNITTNNDTTIVSNNDTTITTTNNTNIVSNVTNIESTNNTTIVTDNTTNNYTWTFDNQGNLYLPEGGTIFNFTGDDILGISLQTDLSVVQQPGFGTGALTYDNTQGIFQYTPADFSNVIYQGALTIEAGATAGIIINANNNVQLGNNNNIFIDNLSTMSLNIDASNNFNLTTNLFNIDASSDITFNNVLSIDASNNVNITNSVTNINNNLNIDNSNNVSFSTATYNITNSSTSVLNIDNSNNLTFNSNSFDITNNSISVMNIDNSNSLTFTSNTFDITNNSVNVLNIDNSNNLTLTSNSFDITNNSVNVLNIDNSNNLTLTSNSFDITNNSVNVMSIDNSNNFAFNATSIDFNNTFNIDNSQSISFVAGSTFNFANTTINNFTFNDIDVVNVGVTLENNDILGYNSAASEWQEIKLAPQVYTNGADLVIDGGAP